MINFKNTLNFPAAEFPMKANLLEKEPETLRKWREENDYQRLREARNGAKKFILHCGPPYANGKLHGGHLIPNMLKDIVVRYKSMEGYDVPYIPGWDCHGLPIEWKIERELIDKGESKTLMSTTSFRTLCRSYASHWIDDQAQDWQRMGCIADWENPYRTMDYQNEANIARELGKIASAGLLYKDYKPVMWSPIEQTALAEAEIEYEDRDATSVYVKFARIDNPKESFVAWTTTPWTLPLNKALALGDEINYQAIRVLDGDKAGQIFWVAAERMNDFIKAAHINEHESLQTVQGKTLTGLRLSHPVYSGDVPLVSSNHVTADNGTGIVHISPAHGIDDFNIGKKYNLDLHCYIDGKGAYEADIPDLPITKETIGGKTIKASEAAILSELAANGSLLAKKVIIHSYPISWRSKSPLIMRSTSQWFMALDKPYTADGRTLREVALTEIDNTSWIPQEGRERIMSMIKDRADWCISRQRIWGSPITIMSIAKTGEYILSPEVFESIAKKVEKHGIDAWSDLAIEDLLPEGWLETNGLTANDLKKEEDILDVWFDSGSSYAHVLQHRGLGNKADLYLEGSDQHRGWFQSSLLISSATNYSAPYDSVLTHGFVVDEKGKKISKSLGNGDDAINLMNKYGADILRLWIVSSDYRSDIRFSPNIMKSVSESYRKMRNTMRFMISNLYDHDAQEDTPYDDMSSIDQWVLARFDSVLGVFEREMGEYKFSKAFSAIQNFCVNDLSSIYFDMRKDVLYCDDEKSPERRSAQTALAYLFDGLVTRIAPFMPYTCDEMWRYVKGPQEMIYTQTFPKQKAEWKNDSILNQFEYLLDLRGKVNKAAEEMRSSGEMQSMANWEITVTSPEPIDDDSFKYEDLLSFFKCAKIQIKAGSQFAIAAHVTDMEKCPRCWNHRELTTHFGTCARCDDVLKNKDVSFIPNESWSPT